MNIQARKTGITILSGIVIAAVLLATPGLVPERSPLSAAPAYAAKTSGWEKQNNGTWKYYVKSKAVTGWQQIGGKWYFFSSN
ncbi:MAG: hypothetical protein LBC58_04285 [Clostridiales Family XIII bacterium]|jgi:hypothetical protein|nr:hypothetical protein [Clostridiales Family XIII bacterium]